MTIIQEVQEKQKRKMEFQNLQENCLIREIKLLIFLKKKFFRIKITHLKQKKKKNQKKNKKKSQKKKTFLNILRMNRKVLIIICLKIILITLGKYKI